MYTITLEETDDWDDEKQLFVARPSVTLTFEHSLLSLSKWESEFKKPFLGSEKTQAEVLQYLWYMCLTPEISPEVILRLNVSQLDSLNEYIAEEQTATTFRTFDKRRGQQQIITSELIYYWLVVYNISWEVQEWHLSRLLTLVRICNEKQSKPKSIPKAEMAQMRREENERRRKEFGTKG